MKAESIALIGFRATGKSLVGSILAPEIGWDFVDMDSELAASLEMEIRDWVELHGWGSFREEETRLLKALCGREKVVLSTGGGVVLSASNREALKKNFIVVWLRASAETILARLASDPSTCANRPPLTALPLKEEVERALQERSPLYEGMADMVLDADETLPEALVVEISSRLLSGGTAGT